MAEEFKKAGASLTLDFDSKSILPQAGKIPTIPPSLAAQAATRLYACYRKDEFSNPEVFITGAAAIFQRYEAWIVGAVIHPLNGLPGELNWPPSMAEIRAACDKLDGFRLRQEARQKAESEQKTTAAAAETAREARPSLDDLRAKHGPNWGIKGEEDTEAAKKRKAVKLEHIAKANDILLHKEYMAAGMDMPAREYAASPSLAKLLHDNPVPMKRGGGREPL